MLPPPISDEYQLWRSSLSNFLHPVLPPPWVPILPSAPCLLISSSNPPPNLWVRGQLSRRTSLKKRPARSWNVSASQGILSCLLSVKFQSQKPGQKSKCVLDDRYIPGSIPWKGQERDFSSPPPPNWLWCPNQPSIQYTPHLFPSRYNSQDMKLTIQLQPLPTLRMHGPPLPPYMFMARCLLTSILIEGRRTRSLYG